jgi:receptor protein-tyrosine kinase
LLRTNLLVTLAETADPTVLITSAQPNEGKTATAVNLALSIASAGKSVGLIDLDLRRPSAHNWLGLPNDVGASDVLLERRRLGSCLHRLEVATGVAGSPGHLTFLPAGPAVDSSTELLGAGRTSRLLEAMLDLGPSPFVDRRNHLDVVLIDSPPTLPVADALILGRIVSAALLVVEAGKTPGDVVQHAKDALIRNQTRLLGIIMNGRSPNARSEDGNGYGYGYEAYPARSQQ